MIRSEIAKLIMKTCIIVCNDLTLTMMKMSKVLQLTDMIMIKMKKKAAMFVNVELRFSLGKLEGCSIWIEAKSWMVRL